MRERKSLADQQVLNTHHYDALGHLLDTAKYYLRLKERGIGRSERREALQHLIAVADTTVAIEGNRATQTRGERVREAVRLVR